MLMRKTVICLITLLTLNSTFAQKEKSDNGTVELRPLFISIHDLANNENNSLNYHKDVNQAIKDILDGRAMDGIMTLKTALYTSRTTLPIDWFMAGFAYALLNDRKSCEAMLNESITKDGKLDSLFKTKLPSQIIGGMMGEKAWKEFSEKKRDLKNKRPDWLLIQTIKELERLDLLVITEEQIHRDSILVHHKNDKKIIEAHRNLIQTAKSVRDNAYNKVINSDAWPLAKFRKSGETDLYIEYSDSPDWFQKNEGRLINLLYKDKLLPWELAFIHDWHAKRHKQAQKYALFYGQRLDERIIMNCKNIGMPWGVVRDVRLFYLFPETL
jgi:hypothetical protein